jgi:hypothetical protein
MLLANLQGVHLGYRADIHQGINRGMKPLLQFQEQVGTTGNKACWTPPRWLAFSMHPRGIERDGSVSK